MIVSRFPYPLEKGDKLRAYHQLRELSRYYSITLVALTDQNISQSQLEQVRQYCETLEVCKLSFFSKTFNLFACFFNQRPFQTGYFYSWRAKRSIRNIISTQKIDHIFCQLIRTSEYVKDEHRIPKTLDYMDALSTGIQRRIEKQPFYKKWLFRSEAKRLFKYEQHIFDYFEHKIIISEQDKNLIHHPDRAEIVCIPNGIDDSFLEKNDTEKIYDFVFVGNMSYPPNIDAVVSIVENILPKFPDATLLVSGSSPHSSIVSLAKSNPKVTLTGWVEDIRTSYAQGKIFLAPMMIGTGMQNKLLEAMAMKIPCVTTPLANNAIKAKHGKEIMVGADISEIIKAIQQLREDSELSESIAKAGSKFVEENYSWEKSVRALRQLMCS
jgi:sugar transferase (PEP-CTERM/EpsH1 system associated)